MSTDAKIRACEVSQTLLEITGEALMTRDFDTFASVFALPQRMETFDGKVLFQTRDELAAMFFKMCDYFEALGVTDLIRECISADYKSDTRIEATHMSHLLRKGTRLIEPYPVFSTLEMVDATWVITSGKYAIDSTSGSGRVIYHNGADKDDAS